MNKESITQLSKWLKVPFFAESPQLKIIDASTTSLMNDNSTEEQILEAIDNMEVIYTQNKLKYSYVERRMIEQSIGKMKTVPVLKIAQKTAKAMATPIMDKAIRPAINHAVRPAAAAVGGFFKGLFSSSK